MKQGEVAIRPRLLTADRGRLRGIKPVRVVDIYDGASSNYHPEGLFSTEIFGRTGSLDRFLNMSYIDLKIPVFNPLAFKALANRACGWPVPHQPGGHLEFFIEK